MTHEEFEKFVSNEMRSGFARWWNASDWSHGRPCTIREVTIAQDAYAEGWVRGVATVLGLHEKSALPSKPAALPIKPTSA